MSNRKPREQDENCYLPSQEEIKKKAAAIKIANLKKIRSPEKKYAKCSKGGSGIKVCKINFDGRWSPDQI